MIVPEGWFKGKKANIETLAGGDIVRIEGETVFSVKNGRIVFEGDYDERDLWHVYQLLRGQQNERDQK